ncbi:hypothetical protein CGRA01v4_11729 [Colletotrichum graminicola]|nr:hypothetical protein CGRA01v4_11729 [Colletotrichum graminicola]
MFIVDCDEMWRTLTTKGPINDTNRSRTNAPGTCKLKMQRGQSGR